MPGRDFHPTVQVRLRAHWEDPPWSEQLTLFAGRSSGFPLPVLRWSRRDLGCLRSECSRRAPRRARRSRGQCQYFWAQRIFPPGLPWPVPRDSLQLQPLHCHGQFEAFLGWGKRIHIHDSHLPDRRVVDRIDQRRKIDGIPLPPRVLEEVGQQNARDLTGSASLPRSPRSPPTIP